MEQQKMREILVKRGELLVGEVSLYRADITGENGDIARKAITRTKDRIHMICDIGERLGIDKYHNLFQDITKGQSI